ncbi:hypothetical protein AC249_AIPGENE21985 [Exaiptasia diaphana]|nr:hypothetical protein AC249_AIPGENE21985 [Exaiptasia diaphana]
MADQLPAKLGDYANKLEGTVGSKEQNQQENFVHPVEETSQEPTNSNTNQNQQENYVHPVEETSQEPTTLNMEQNQQENFVHPVEETSKEPTSSNMEQNQGENFVHPVEETSHESTTSNMHVTCMSLLTFFNLWSKAHQRQAQEHSEIDETAKDLQCPPAPRIPDGRQLGRDNQDLQNEGVLLIRRVKIPVEQNERDVVLEPQLTIMRPIAQDSGSGPNMEPVFDQDNLYLLFHEHFQEAIVEELG